MGRITGFDVEFDDLTKASQRGLLVDADSEVDLFRTEAGAARYIAREAGEFRRLEGKRLQYGIVVDQVSYFAATGLRGARGVHFRLRAGGLTFWATGVLFQVGTLVASAELGRTDARDVRADVRQLAVALNRRIHGVLAGNVHDNPIGTTTPKLGGLGPPAGGPDLASMAIAPADFDGSARPTHQGYVRNTDDIAAYVREFRSVTFGSSTLAWLKSEVELRPSAKAANDFVSLLRSLLHGPRGRTFMQGAITSGFSPSDRKEVRIGRVSQLKVQEGDASVALSTSFTTRGLSFQSVLLVGPSVWWIPAGSRARLWRASTKRCTTNRTLSFSRMRRKSAARATANHTRGRRKRIRRERGSSCQPRGGSEMFHAGDQIENPVTGERLVFHETSAETNGERA